MRPRRRSVLQALLSPIATKLISWGFGYYATDPRRKILDQTRLMASRQTSNQLLNGSRAQLRDYCRELERNNPTARAGVEALTALLVGSGIALEPDTGDEALDQQISAEFTRWCESCGVNGESLWHLQGLGVREMVTAGEGLWRLVYDDAAEPGDIPLRILPLDAEFLRDDAAGTDSTLTTVAGLVVDNLGRPRLYLLANPESDKAEEVKAEAVVHFFEKRRPVQHRGEPWFCPLIETLIQERDLVDAELYAAKQTAALGIAIESEFQPGLDTDEHGDSSDPVQNLKIGSAVRMFPGEKVHAFSHTRPSQQIAPFRQMLRGDIAAALRIPQRFLDRDVSRANYSSMRADMIDSERLLGPVREWYGKQTIGAVYERVLPYLAARLGVNVPRATYRLLPDGQPYVDPQKDAQAAILAIEGKLTTFEAEIAKRGGDYRQVWAQSEREATERAAAEIAQIQAIQKLAEASGVPGLTWQHILTIKGAAVTPGAYLQAASADPEQEPETQPEVQHAE
jgi:lambda family phage portal protein